MTNRPFDGRDTKREETCLGPGLIRHDVGNKRHDGNNLAHFRHMLLFYAVGWRCEIVVIAQSMT
jgi:hypothetical protein